MCLSIFTVDRSIRHYADLIREDSLKMWTLFASLLASAALACNIPEDILSNNIPNGFSIQLQNGSYPQIHNHYLNLWAWGGGDQHLFVSPAGNSTSELTLVDGIITLPWDPIRRAVINLEYEPKDNTTKMCKFPWYIQQLCRRC